MPEQSFRHHVVKENPWHSYEVTIDTLSDRNAVTAAASSDGVIATGSAKRAPGDPNFEALGETIAVGRALVALGQHLLDCAENRLDQ